MWYYETLLVLGAVVVGHCFFLAFLLLRLSQKLANRLLAVLLLFLAIRVGGCIAGLLYPDFELTGMFLSGMSMAVIGPLYHYYLDSLWQPALKLRAKDKYHLLPGIIALGLLPIQHWKMAVIVYFSGLALLLIYVISGFLKFYKERSIKKSDDVQWKWTLYLSSALLLLVLLFMGQLFLFQEYVYLSLVLTATLVSYVLSLWAVKHTKLFLQKPRKKNGQHAKMTALGKEIEHLLKEEAVFADPQITVSKLAKRLNEPAYLVSLAINEYFNRSFPEILSELRVQLAIQFLTDGNKQQYTIEAIAYESGFSTLSSFYSTFKRITSKTPLQYKKQSNSMDIMDVPH